MTKELKKVYRNIMELKKYLLLNKININYFAYQAEAGYEKRT